MYVLFLPATYLCAGLALGLGALGLAWQTPGVPAGLTLAVAALLTGIGIALRPKGVWVLLSGGLGFFLYGCVVWASDKVWGAEGIDTGATGLFWLASALCVVAAVMLLLPRGIRRFCISLLVLFHFFGIGMAVLSIPPTPWLASKLWLRVYRPYLQFAYLNNHYQFFAPEPGPQTLLWFCIEYEPDPDGTRNFRWVQVPRLDQGRAEIEGETGGTTPCSQVQLQRRLMLAMNVGQSPHQPHEFLLKTLAQKRQAKGLLDGIPMHASLAAPQQYWEPNAHGKRWIASFAGHAARTYKHPEKPDLKVRGVKVYLVSHRLLLPYDLAAAQAEPSKSISPDDPANYRPFYMGEFDANGKMKGSCFRLHVDEYGNSNQYDLTQRDPYLYWLIPNRNLPGAKADSSDEKAKSRIQELVRKHAEDRPGKQKARREGGLP